MKSSSVLLRNSFKTFTSIPEMHKPRCLKSSPYAPLLQPSQLHFPCLTDFHFCPSCIFSFIFFFFSTMPRPRFPCHLLSGPSGGFHFYVRPGKFHNAAKGVYVKGRSGPSDHKQKTPPTHQQHHGHHPLSKPNSEKKKIRLTIHFRALGSINCFY